MKLFFLLAPIILTAAIMVPMISMRRTCESNAATMRAKLETVCSNVQTTLKLDAREIRKGGPLKQQVISRVFSEDHAGDGVTTLSACLTTPFDIDAWSSCKLNSDDACLARILETSAASVAYGTPAQ